MFRKLPSSQKDTTVFEALKHEFAPQVGKAKPIAEAFIQRHTKAIFCAMILMIVASFVLTFFVLRTDPGERPDSFKQELGEVPKGLGGEFSAIQDLSSRAIKMAELKTEIERIIGQDSISKFDSAYLEKAIEQLQYFNPNSNEDEN